MRAVRVRSFSLFLVQLDWCKLWIYIFLRMQLCSELLGVNEQTADPPCLRLIILVRSSSPLMEQGTYNRRFSESAGGGRWFAAKGLTCCSTELMVRALQVKLIAGPIEADTFFLA